MSYDETLAQRLHQAFARAGVSPVKKTMFGGLAFMVNGHMSCGVNGNDLMARVGPDGHDEALRQPHARPMDFTGRPLRGFVFVAAEGVREDERLDAWVNRSLAFVQTLPAK